MSVFVGIDPGLSGGIAILGGRSDGEPEVWDMPTLALTKGRALDVKALRSLFTRLFNINACVAIEKAINMPKQGAKQRATTRENYGRLIGMLDMAGIPYEEIPPKEWKRAFRIPPKSDKNESLVRAEQLFPTANLHGPKGGARDGLAEALLIAEWLRRSSTPSTER